MYTNGHLLLVITTIEYMAACIDLVNIHLSYKFFVLKILTLTQGSYA